MPAWRSQCMKKTGNNFTDEEELSGEKAGWR